MNRRVASPQGQSARPAPEDASQRAGCVAAQPTHRPPAFAPARPHRRAAILARCAVLVNWALCAQNAVRTPAVGDGCVQDLSAASRNRYAGDRASRSAPPRCSALGPGMRPAGGPARSPAAAQAMAHLGCTRGERTCSDSSIENPSSCAPSPRLGRRAPARRGRTAYYRG